MYISICVNNSVTTVITVAKFKNRAKYLFLQGFFPNFYNALYITDRYKPLQNRLDKAFFHCLSHQTRPNGPPKPSKSEKTPVHKDVTERFKIISTTDKPVPHARYPARSNAPRSTSLAPKRFKAPSSNLCCPGIANL